MRERKQPKKECTMLATKGSHRVRPQNDVPYGERNHFSIFEAIHEMEKFMKFLWSKLHNHLPQEHKKLSLYQVLIVARMPISAVPISAGELEVACYEGSNGSYNRKKLVSWGYLISNVCEHDKRLHLFELTEKGKELRGILDEFCERQVIGEELALVARLLSGVCTTKLR